MRTAIFFVAMIVLALPAHAIDFARESAFDSVETFVSAAKAFQPAASKGDFSALFSVPEMGEDDHNQPVTALAIESCSIVWSGEDAALLTVVANPPTVATRASVGVLFLLVRQGSQWQIADLLRFTATGKYAEVSAKLTAGADSDRPIPEGFDPVITIKESQGGRGYSYEVSASYTFSASKLKRLELK